MLHSHRCAWLWSLCLTRLSLNQLAIGENSALAIPVPVLIAIFFAFIAGVVYVILQIFESDKKRLRKADEKKAKRDAKEAKKSVSSKKKA